jgi:hypothetical protein
VIHDDNAFVLTSRLKQQVEPALQQEKANNIVIDIFEKSAHGRESI